MWSFEGATVDDLMHDALITVVEHGEEIEPSKGPSIELYGCTLQLSEPRARLSRSAVRGLAFSPLGELAWYLNGSNEVADVAHYVPKYLNFAEPDGKVHGGYGPRIFGEGPLGQIRRAIDQLSRNRATRKAVVQIFDSADVSSAYRDVPCTCTLQFLIRRGALQMVVYMRSNDLFTGFPHDLFCFTMIQELVAKSLNVDVGTYTHMVGSLHVYADDLPKVRQFLSEGFQELAGVMPSMPDGDPWPGVSQFLAAEGEARAGRVPLDLPVGDPYWTDLSLLLEAFAVRRNAGALVDLRSRFSNDAYWPYIRARLDRLGIEGS